jgi:hypothetical protein
MSKYRYHLTLDLPPQMSADLKIAARNAGMGEKEYVRTLVQEKLDQLAKFPHGQCSRCTFPVDILGLCTRSGCSESH